MTDRPTRGRSAYALVLLTLVYGFNIADRDRQAAPQSSCS
jgi:hypothetical protein